MSDLVAPPRPVTVEPEDTLDDLADTLRLLNAEAKSYSRRGYCGTRTEDYARWHARLDEVLTSYEAKANARPS